MPAALSLLRNALFSVAIGSNDFINNYLTPVVSAPERAVVSPEAFVKAMISKFRMQLTVIPCCLVYFLCIRWQQRYGCLLISNASDVIILQKCDMSVLDSSQISGNL